MCTRLQRRPGPIEAGPIEAGPIGDEDPLSGEDLQLTLHLCFGLHYDGFAGVDDGWEWEPSLVHLRSRLERRFLASLAAVVPQDARPGAAQDGESPVDRVRRLIGKGATGPSLSQFMVERGDVDQLREFVTHRSIYQRKEADPHTWAIPRLRAAAKSAIVTLQSDEYGNGIRGKSHAELFATTMSALDLDPTPGAYIDQVPGVTLATDNLISMLGLSRRWRGALVGHLAAFEMTSVEPMSRYAKALRRLQVADAAVEFYDVHVVADKRHATIAADDLIGGLAESDPEAAVDVPFGAATLLELEARFGRHLLETWKRGNSSLLTPASGRQPSGVELVPLLVVEPFRFDTPPMELTAHSAAI